MFPPDCCFEEKMFSFYLCFEFPGLHRQKTVEVNIYQFSIRLSVRKLIFSPFPKLPKNYLVCDSLAQSSSIHIDNIQLAKVAQQKSRLVLHFLVGSKKCVNRLRIGVEMSQQVENSLWELNCWIKTVGNVYTEKEQRKSVWHVQRTRSWTQPDITLYSRYCRFLCCFVHYNNFDRAFLLLDLYFIRV